MYDTIIIGAGLSGLAAGIRLAYFDRSVCVLERHTTIGGLNSFYRLRGQNYDVGLHAITNYAEPGTRKGPLSKLLRQLRLSWEDFALRPQNESRVVFPGHDLRFTNDFEELRDGVGREFPDQKAGFDRLVTRIEQHDALNLGRQEISGRKVVGEYLSDPVLIDMLFCPLMFYGSPTPHDMDFNQFVIMFNSIFREGFGRPWQGVRLIMKQLVRQYRGVGGELRLRSGVRRIHSRRDSVTAVELDDGTQLEARNVVSSAGLAETLQLCGVEQPTGDDRPGEISFVETIFSLDRPPADFDYPTTVLFYNDNADFQYACPDSAVDTRSGIICSPNNFAYDSPLQINKIRITALARPDAWLNLPDDEYYRLKEAACREIAESAVRVMPDFRDYVVDTDVFTPRTIRKFTGHINGCVYGAPHKRVDGRTHLKNLYLCGTDQGFLGIVGAMLSGITIANRYLLD